MAKKDRGQQETDRVLAEIEKRINKEYSQAIEGIESELADYLRRFELKDKKWQEWVEDGTKTQAEYDQWRFGQLAVGRRWSEQKDAIAEELFKVNEKAKETYQSSASEIFAENVNFATYEIERDAKINTSFTLYSKESVDRLIKEDPDVLPGPGRKVSREIAEGKAVRWNRQQLQSVMIQGILQGDSIPKLATRLATTVGDRNRKAAIRNARTMATAAQNAGRVNAYKRAESKGVEMEQMWLATMDNRTRHSHRWLDHEVRPVGEAFSNGCEYPGDPKGDPAEIYNCRCSLRGVVKGLERRSGQFRDDSKIDGMTYDEWRDAKPESNSITLPDEKGKSAKGAYINSYKNNGELFNYNTGAHSIPLNGKEKVSYNSDAEYIVNVNRYNDEVNKALSEAARAVAEAGSKDGCEWAALVNINTGAREFFDTDGYNDSVGCYHKYLEDNPNSNYAMVHNHDKESSLSYADVCELPQWNNLDSVTAVTNNGITSTALSNGIKTNEVLDVKYMADYRRIAAETHDAVEAEYAVVDMVLNDYGEGEIIRYDGRR